MAKNYLSGIFGASPVHPLQVHMAKVTECTGELIKFFECVNNNDWDAAAKIRERVKQFEAGEEQAAREKGDSGIQKELDIISGITPKAAKELLKLKPDAEVARILLAIDNRKVNKIVKQCKTSEERLWIGRVLEQLHDRDAARAEDPGAGT